MNDIAVGFLRSMLNQKTCAFYFPISIELGMIGEIQVLFHDKEGNEGAKRHALLFKDQEFILRIFGQDNTNSIEDSMMDQSVSFGTEELTIKLICPRPIRGTRIKDVSQKFV